MSGLRAQDALLELALVDSVFTGGLGRGKLRARQILTGLNVKYLSQLPAGCYEELERLALAAKRELIDELNNVTYDDAGQQR